MADNSHGRHMARGGTVTKADRLLQAAQDGDMQKVKKLVKQGIDVNYESPLNGADAVGIAAEFNEHKVIKFLLDAKARLDHGSRPNGVTPLLMAVQFEHVETIQLLCDRKCDVEKRATQMSWKGDRPTPLMLAARHNRWKAIEVLLKAGANVQPRAPDSFDPLHEAVKQGSVESCKLLINA